MTKDLEQRTLGLKIGTRLVSHVTSNVEGMTPRRRRHAVGENIKCPLHDRVDTASFPLITGHVTDESYADLQT